VLLASPRYAPADLRRWSELERQDAAVARSARMAALEHGALVALRDFALAGPCYASVSWGKDSVVLAHLAFRLRADGLRIPLVWFRRTDHVDNPDCAAVRDAFLSARACEYREVEAPSVGPGSNAAADFAAASPGERRATGIRAEEARGRAVGLAHRGLSTEQTCAPLGWWRSEHVFAYLFAHQLPVHPAYACLMDGQWPREEIRVATIGGRRGVGRGRREWERRYYPDELRRDV
jgi:phosphoadenosine phosphosulfate reductase